MAPKKVTEANHQTSSVAVQAKRTQDVKYVAAYTSAPPAPTIQQPKIDATDRRQIECQNEDKSHSTKETLDDIKHIHYKEKKKKEQNNMEPGPSGLNLQEKVRKIWILKVKSP